MERFLEWVRFAGLMAAMFLLARVFPASYLFFAVFVPITGAFVGWLMGRATSKDSLLRDAAMALLALPIGYGIITAPWAVIGYLSWAQWMLLPIGTMILGGSVFAIMAVGSLLRRRRWERLTR